MQNSKSSLPLVVRASPPSDEVQARLGPLAELPGTWSGKGFNLVSLPDRQHHQKFRLMLNATQESLTFTAIGGPIPNRGNLQDDISFLGLRYLQTVNDAVTNEGLHVEPGLWLNVPETTAPKAGPSVVRLSTIPHGDSVLAQGDFLELEGGPQIGIADSTPFTLGPDGARINDTHDTYLAPYRHTPPPPGIPAEAIANPNVVLQAAIEGQNIVKTVTLIVNASPVGGINDTPVTPEPGAVGGIVNIPFVVANANANSMSAIFWIEWVKRTDGTHFLQLQYTQTVILDFPVPGPDGKKMVDIKWPHISVATLIKG